MTSYTPKQSGFSLLENLITLLISAFAIVAITKYTADIRIKSSDNSIRQTFLQFADQFIAQVHADPNNLPCYSPGAPAPNGSTSCSSSSATSWMTSYQTAISTTPSYKTLSTSWNPSTNQVKFQVSWNRKSSQLPIGYLTIYITPTLY